MSVFLCYVIDFFCLFEKKGPFLFNTRFLFGNEFDRLTIKNFFEEFRFWECLITLLDSLRSVFLFLISFWVVERKAKSAQARKRRRKVNNKKELDETGTKQENLSTYFPVLQLRVSLRAVGHGVPPHLGPETYITLVCCDIPQPRHGLQEDHHQEQLTRQHCV